MLPLSISLSLAPILWTGLGLWTTYILSIIIYRIFFHPLAKYPGPILGKFTEYHTYAAVLRDDLTYEQDRLYQKYGSPYRISTNSIIFADSKSWGDVFGQSSNPCIKDPGFYDAFTVTGEKNLLNVVDRFHHARLRRLLSHAFSAKCLLESEAMFSSKIGDYVRLVLDSSASEGSKTIDIYEDTHSLFLDIVSHLSFGESFDCLEGRNLTAHRDLEAFMTVIPATSFLPPLKYLPLKSLKEGYKGVERLKNFSREKVNDVIRRCEKDEDEESVKGTFLHRLITAVDPETGSKLTMEEMVENAIIFLVAGSGTTAATTCYFLWEIGRTPDVRKKLLDEIRTAFPDPNVVPTYEKAVQLPYLAACIQETLRLYGPINMAVPRISPGRMISDHYIPAGTVVSTLAYATARDPNIFSPDPERFRPERWLDGAVTPEMKNMSRPFSYGPRNCIGKHLAEIVLTLTLARMYQLFDIELDPAMTDDMMRMRDRGVMEPWGAKLLVKCTRI